MLLVLVTLQILFPLCASVLTLRDAFAHILTFQKQLRTLVETTARADASSAKILNGKDTWKPVLTESARILGEHVGSVDAMYLNIYAPKVVECVGHLKTLVTFLQETPVFDTAATVKFAAFVLDFVYAVDEFALYRDVPDYVAPAETLKLIRDLCHQVKTPEAERLIFIMESDFADELYGFDYDEAPIQIDSPAYKLRSPYVDEDDLEDDRPTASDEGYGAPRTSDQEFYIDNELEENLKLFDRAASLKSHTHNHKTEEWHRGGWDALEEIEYDDDDEYDHRDQEDFGEKQDLDKEWRDFVQRHNIVIPSYGSESDGPKIDSDVFSSDSEPENYADENRFGNLPVAKDENSGSRIYKTPLAREKPGPYSRVVHPESHGGQNRLGRRNFFSNRP